MSVLRLENVKKTFEGGPEVLRGISLAVEEGEVVAIIGPSGGGKSTLLRCMIDLEEVTGGSIYVGEDAMVKDGKYCSKAERARLISEMGMVFQGFNLFPHMTVRENLIKPYLLTKPGAADAEEKCMALLEKVGLAEKKDEYPCRLSGGQQQRVAIARALMRDPKVMLFDEPTSALDPQLTGEVLVIMQQLAAEHRTMVVVTHEMSFARGAANRILYVNGGLIAEEGTPEEIFGAPKTAELRAFLGSGFED